MNLRTLSIGGFGLKGQHASHLVQQIHEMIIGGATFTSLSLDAPRDHELKTSVLNELFHHAPHHATPTLRCMRLHGYSMILDAVTLPQMRDLRALDLSLADGADKEPLWDALRTSSVHLTELSVHNSDDTEALVRYLQSYRGLEHFSISKLRWKNISDANTFQKEADREDFEIAQAQRISHELLRDALLLHKDSLVSYTGFNMAWICVPSCMTDESMPLLSQFPKLRTLGFSWSTLDLHNNDKLPGLVSALPPRRQIIVF